MTKRDYEAIAAILACHNDPVAWSIADDLATLFEDRNPRFDRDKFLRACQSPRELVK